jgi:hypothetical protein
LSEQNSTLGPMKSTFCISRLSEKLIRSSASPFDISMDADEEEDDNESINNVDDKADGAFAAYLNSFKNINGKVLVHIAHAQLHCTLCF